MLLQRFSQQVKRYQDTAHNLLCQHRSALSPRSSHLCCCSGHRLDRTPGEHPHCCCCHGRHRRPSHDAMLWRLLHEAWHRASPIFPQGPCSACCSLPQKILRLLPHDTLLRLQQFADSAREQHKCAQTACSLGYCCDAGTPFFFGSAGLNSLVRKTSRVWGRVCCFKKISLLLFGDDGLTP